MYVIIGGSRGLGKEIIQVLLDKEYEVINISRSNLETISKNLTNINKDLISLDKHEVSQIFNQFDNLDGIIFSQRFRKRESSIQTENYVDEYKSSVISTSNIIEAYREYQHSRVTQSIGSIILVGSTYSSSIGFDQDWSYHACKFAQEALVKYYSVHSQGKFSINLVCPASYMKEGTEEYWTNSPKSEIWKKYPVKKLAGAKFIAMSIVDLLLNSTLFNTGNKIMLDGGVSNIYHDQDIIE